MDNNYPITDRIALVAAHLRLIADLMLEGPDLKEVDRAAFALVLQDLTVRLEAATRETARTVLAEEGQDRERQP